MTVTFHNGSAAHREHNIRKPSATSKQGHIDPARSDRNVVFVDIVPREAYVALFGDALAAYNAKQKRPERKISDYFNHISGDAQKHAVYECIIQIGSRDDHVDYELEKDILTRFYRGWANRNPNLFLCGAYLHADEDGGTHLHIDYIPFADGYKKGLSRQSALVRAFGDQGIVGTSAKATAQIIWERSERQTIADLCIEQGISVDATVGGRKHENTPEFKAKKASLDELSSAIGEQTVALKQTTAELEAATIERQKLATETGERLVFNMDLHQQNNEFEDALTLRRKAAQRQDIVSLAQPVPLRRDFVMLKKDDWKNVAALAQNEAATAAILDTERQSRKRVELDLDHWRGNSEPFKKQVAELTVENFKLQEYVAALREERNSLAKLIRSILSYLREHIPAIFDVIDRMVDKQRSLEHQKYPASRSKRERGGYDGYER